MDRANLRNMYRICGGDFAGKMHLLMDFTAHSGEVADPWYTDGFDATWHDVEEGIAQLLIIMGIQSHFCMIWRGGKLNGMEQDFL